MVNQLLNLTRRSLSGDLMIFRYTYYCGMGIAQDLEFDKLEKGVFYDNGTELLIYNNRNTIFSCSYTEYCNVKFITHVYNTSGLYKTYEFDYESKENKCLYDIYELKKEESDLWIYRLESIYDKYGVDTVNLVRENAHLWN